MAAGTRQPAKKSSPRAGTIALVGRPNVGKSTLMNALLGERIAITSHQPQTTRDRIAGILTRNRTQFVFLDTPGLHRAKTRLGHRMNDVVSAATEQADVVVMVTDVAHGDQAEVRAEDRAILDVLGKKPAILVLNKIDRLKLKAELIEVLRVYGEAHDFAAIVPLSAKKRDGLDRMLGAIEPLLPEGEPLYPEDELSDKPVRFFVAELVREQILTRTRQEVPHGVAVTVDAYEEPSKHDKPTRITMTIHVAKDSHKGIIIGQGGQMLGAIGSAARARAERLIGGPVHLDVRVRATPGWFDDAARLNDLGYGDGDAPQRKRGAPSRAQKNGRQKNGPQKTRAQKTGAQSSARKSTPTNATTTAQPTNAPKKKS